MRACRIFQVDSHIEETAYVQPVTCSVCRMTACSAELNLGDTQKMRFYFNYNGVIKAQEA